MRPERKQCGLEVFFCGNFLQSTDDGLMSQMNAVEHSDRQCQRRLGKVSVKIFVKFQRQKFRWCKYDKNLLSYQLQIAEV